jgi:ATP-dependent exoDNAse (exonuclease V) alpha subunit
MCGYADNSTYYRLKKNILNSQKFIVKQIKDKKIILNDEDNEVVVDINKFHKYFYLGFCITIHASQGETFTEPYTIYDWGFKHFCNKAKYVALSRATSIKNIQIV